MSNEIGKKIRVLREKLGYSQEYMAVQLELSQSSYGRLEQQDDRISITVLKRIAEILNISVSTLIDEKIGKFNLQMNNQHAYNEVQKVINSDNEHIESLRKEIDFLKEIVLKKL